MNALDSAMMTREPDADYVPNQESRMFGEARQVIEVMKHEMAQEDDGCTRRIENLERQRHQFEDDMLRHAVHAERMTRERSQRYHNKFNQLRIRAEENVGNQDEQI